jgi:hypothetical protein
MMKTGRRKILQTSLSLLPGVQPFFSAIETQSTNSSRPDRLGDFIAKPYLQFGNAKTISAGDSLMLMWHTEDLDSKWAVESKTSENGPWLRAEKIFSRLIVVPTIQPHRVYQAELTRLQAGEDFE